MVCLFHYFQLRIIIKKCSTQPFDPWKGWNPEIFEFITSFFEISNETDDDGHDVVLGDSSI